MAEQIWFFLEPESNDRLVVVGLDSARTLAKILGVWGQRWHVRKGKDGQPRQLNACAELFEAKERPNTLTGFKMPEALPEPSPMPVLVAASRKQSGTRVSTATYEQIEELLLAPRGSEAPVEASVRGHLAVPPKVDMNELVELVERKVSARARELTGPDIIERQVIEREKVAAISDPAPAKRDRKETRKHPRIDSRFRVIVVAGKRCFRSFTKNVSQGGILLEHNIPKDLVGVDCKVVIGSIDMRENIEFSARIVVHGDHPRSFAFTDGNSTFLDRLMLWTEVARHAPSPKKAA